MPLELKPYNLPAVEMFTPDRIGDNLDYDSVSQVLDSDDGTRLALYVPFELLQKPINPLEQQGHAEFIDVYMRAWRKLLSVHDVRANFIDGDVVEEDFRYKDLDRIVKAVELIPRFIRLGLLSYSDVEQLYHMSDDPLLRKGLFELFSAPAHTPNVTIHVSQRRQQWLDDQRSHADVRARAKQFGAAILNSGSIDLPLDQSGIEGLYDALHILVRGGKPTKDLLVHYESWLDDAWKMQYPGLQTQLARVYRRLHSLAVLSMAELSERNVSVPRLDGQFSDNLRYIDSDVVALQAITERIKADELLEASVYPVVLIGGSKLKGYGDENSDVDTSILIKPGVSQHDSQEIRARLDNLLGNYDPILFWLDQGSDHLEVHDFEKPDIHTADSLWTHVLFGSAWIGDEQAILKLKEQLLPTYYSSRDSRRKYYLERMEQDVLQYRLLHHGYARQKALQVVSDKDVFWDSGYRHTATKLFVNNVRLPKK